MEVDVAAKTAEQRAPLPNLARGDVAVAAVSATSMLVDGGERGQSDRTLVGLHDTVMYDSVADTWVRRCPLLPTHTRCVSLVRQDHLLLSLL